MPSWTACATSDPASSATMRNAKSIPEVTPPEVKTLPSRTHIGQGYTQCNYAAKTHHDNAVDKLDDLGEVVTDQDYRRAV